MKEPQQDISFLLVYGALFAICAAPVFLFTYPPLVDYPNHLARMQVLVHSDDPILRQYYAVRWAALPNLAMDLFVYATGGWLGVVAAGKAFVVLAMFLLSSSALALSYVLHDRVTPVALAACLVLYNYALHLGMVNFLFASGLAVWCFSAYLLATKRWRYLHIVPGTVMACVLMAAHLYGFALYAVLVGVHALRQLGPFAFRALALRAAQFVMPLAAFVAFSPTAAGQSFAHRGGALAKVTHLAYLFPFDGLAGQVAAFAVLAALAALLAWKGKALFAVGMTAVVFVLVALYVALPFYLMSTSNADWRLLIPLAVIACGAMADPLPTRRAGLAFLAVLAVLCMAQSAWVARRWARADEHQQHMAALMRELPPGSKIFPAVFGVDFEQAEQPVAWTHMASVGVIEGGHFLPSLFAYKTQQILVYTKDYEALRSKTRRVVYVNPADVDWETVRERFDYVLVMDPEPTAKRWRAQIPFATAVVDAADPHILLLAVGVR